MTTIIVLALLITAAPTAAVAVGSAAVGAGVQRRVDRSGDDGR